MLWQLIDDFYLSNGSWTVDKIYGLFGLVAQSEDGTSITDLI